MEPTGVAGLTDQAQALPIGFARIGLALGVFGVAYGITFLLRVLLDRVAERFPEHRLLLKRLQPIIRLAVYGIGIYLAVGIVSPEEKTLYALLGSMALALGLAAKDLLNDLIGGIVVLFDRSFQVGDRVAVGGYYGEVVSIGLRSTKLVTPDDSLVTVPNSTLLSSALSNTNAGAIDCQVVTDIYLPGTVDLGQVEGVAREAVLTSKFAYLRKPVVVNVKDEFKETHLTHLVIKAYVFDTRYEALFAADVTRRVRKEFLRRGLTHEDVRFVSRAAEGPVG
ncbi:MAG: mechanosensitive ion channel domain-containing protein [Gemmatimonadota bacterium]